MRVGYNTNGLAHHRWDDAIAVIADAGYQSVAITIDHHCLAPDSVNFRQDIVRMGSLLERYHLHCVIETGARYLLDPFRKHQPTLLSADPQEREVRTKFLARCLDVASELNADAVSFWSGTPLQSDNDEKVWWRLVGECRRLVEIAESRRMRLAFEPEPGMLIETCDQFAELQKVVAHPLFGLTLDVGHVHCLQDGQISDRIRQFAGVLFNIHIEDMRVGEHEHLRFGTGTIDFPPLFEALEEIHYARGLHVELSRHSHMAPEVLRESRDFLSQWIPR